MRTARSGSVAEPLLLVRESPMGTGTSAHTTASGWGPGRSLAPVPMAVASLQFQSYPAGKRAIGPPGFDTAVTPGRRSVELEGI